MRFLVLVKASKDSEAGILPGQKLLEEMGKYNEELAKAGVLMAAEGLQPSSKGVRVKLNSKDEAIDWLKRAPFDDGAEIELRPIFEMEDFGDALTPELKEQEIKLRAQAEQLSKSSK